MKTIIAFTMALLYSTIIFAQKKPNSFLYLGPSLYQYHGDGKPLVGGSIGMGVNHGTGSLGIGVEMLTQKDGGIHPIAYGDLHIKFKKTGTTPFVLFQPGYIALNRSILSNSYVEKGGLFLAGGLGLISKEKKSGFMFQVKYAMMESNIYQKKNNGLLRIATNRYGYFGVSLSVVL